ncbi:Carbonic anhydrase 2 [Streptomyces hundungensis]|uniref:Carbonic anhydrase 2 n=1 Tax=Streptomyces hundungensis TaxID=1077946 RepID=A0A387HB10_9ACTN|nr:Carbonic anhydrase 2 [Streptomyces hundungensis]
MPPPWAPPSSRPAAPPSPPPPPRPHAPPPRMKRGAEQEGSQAFAFWSCDAPAPPGKPSSIPGSERAMAYASAPHPMRRCQPPRAAPAMLLSGNQRFVAGSAHHPNQDAARRTDLAPGQNPFAVLFGRGTRARGLPRRRGHPLCRGGGDHSGRLRARRHREGNAQRAGLTCRGDTQHEDFIAEHIRHSVSLPPDRSRVLADAVAAGSTAVVDPSYRVADGMDRLIPARGIEASAKSNLRGALQRIPYEAPYTAQVARR